MERRRQTPERIPPQATEGRSGLGAGAIGGAGRQGTQGDGPAVLPLTRSTVACGSPRPGGLRLLGGRRRVAAGAAPGGRGRWGRLVGLDRSRLPAVSLPCRRAWGPDGQPKAGGAGVWPRARHRGAPRAAQGEVACDRLFPGPAVPHLSVVHGRATGVRWRPEPTTGGRPLVAVAGGDTTRQPS